MSQEIVLNSFSALLKMSVSNKLKKVKNSDALLCSLFCIKILLKSKTRHNYIESINNLCKIMREGAPFNCVLFMKVGGFDYIHEWIETLLADSENTVLQVSYL
jgi:hypothetical protein